MTTVGLLLAFIAGHFFGIAHVIVWQAARRDRDVEQLGKLIRIDRKGRPTVQLERLK